MLRAHGGAGYTFVASASVPALVPRAGLCYLRDDDNVKCASGACAKVCVCVVVLNLGSRPQLEVL